MGPSTLDLFILTFNCAKTLINVPVFASHLQDALTRNATGLPDLVAFSLQEFAPLSYSFIGGYFLSPYLARFEEALNIAAAQVAAATTTSKRPSSAGGEGEAESDSLLSTNGPQSQGQSQGQSNGGRAKPYHLIRSHNAGMTAVMVFARDPEAVRRLQVAEVGFGAADMGNKGAVGVRVAYAAGDDDGSTAEVTFVATHFAAMEWNLRRRNKNWRSIVSDLVFENPKEVIEGLEGLGSGPKGRLLDSAASQGITPEEEEQEMLLSAEQEAALLQHNDRLRGISVFRPGSHLFVAGDLNYRIGAKTPPPLAAFPSLDASSPDYWPAFLGRDQLTQEREAGRTLHGLSEAPITFPPTYKLDVQSGAEGAVNEAEVRRAGAGAGAGAAEVVPFTYAPHRWPSWCDRVLYLETPRSEAAKVEVLAYEPLPVVRTSDHQAVYLRARVPVLLSSQPAATSSAEAEAEDEDDPRVRLPVPIDVDAYGRRAAARRREVLVGWSMFLWSTREGAVVIATLMLVGVGGWWAWQGV
ncbi:uncharacterized protein E0L32_008398 [Thyridium curvatum]|uniref:Inositol polyphosphate-related phosphatase domain-containing protein n=1 Tax=Thyridium curvatum TaxID=1093900 RepID=A0A507AW08_9PEZI|nr:uncharacterized protein E0L32_008398 [Thyridium curvatum]TPX10664.1 hypothetical protein E0L32_008398 [Thyridium curvatum]